MSNDFEYLNPLHRKHLEMLNDFNTFCEKHDINWCLAYGSVLGARRHGGSIPWDDDVDIYMAAAEYDKFRTAFIVEGNHEKYYLQEKISIEGMVDCPKLRMNNTTFIEDSLKDLDMHHGIFMDIFILHAVPHNPIKRILGKLGGIYIELKIMSNQHYSKRKIFIPLMAFMRLFPKHFGMKTILKKQYKWDRCENSEFSTVWNIDGKKLNNELLYPFKKIKYEDSLLYVPNDVEKYLEITYGDWQTIPNIDSIKWRQHAAFWSTTEDFSKYVSNTSNYSDEMKHY